MIIKRILEIEKESFLTPWNEETYRDMEREKSYTILVEYCENEIAGFVVTLDMFDVEEIIKIAVDKKFRKRGIASLLVDKIIKSAKEKNKDALWLEVRENNLNAINLYKKKNFLPVTIRKKYYEDTGENAVVMKLDLIHNRGDFNEI